ARRRDPEPVLKNGQHHWHLGQSSCSGHFPTEQSALKCVYLAIMSLDPTGKGRKRWSNRWKATLNASEITFDGRLSAGRS
ncbi:hypothetical protein ACQQCD_13140, partial [Pseudarthrobacter sp. J1763]